MVCTAMRCDVLTVYVHVSIFCQNVAGSLFVPTSGTVVRRANDYSCISNDETVSMMLLGPLSAGTRIELSDNADSLCVDDYAAIVLTTDLEEVNFYY
jgi:hypothetical protein